MQVHFSWWAGHIPATVPLLIFEPLLSPEVRVACGKVDVATAPLLFAGEALPMSTWPPGHFLLPFPAEDRKNLIAEVLRTTLQKKSKGTWVLCRKHAFHPRIMIRLKWFFLVLF